MVARMKEIFALDDYPHKVPSPYTRRVTFMSSFVEEEGEL